MPDTNGSTDSSPTEEMRLGELMIELGLLERTELDGALAIVDQTGLALGRVVVLSQYVTEKLLDAALQSQTLIKTRQINIQTARRAIDAIKSGTYPNFDEALRGQGFSRSDDASNNKLGDLLVEAGLISKAQLDGALSQSEQTGLPFGRLLVLSGVITESTLTSTLNAQTLLRNGRVTKDQAIKSLRSGGRRPVATQAAPAERDFYGLPDRRAVLLGELLVASGSITKAQLSNAIEMSVSNGKMLGQVLVESNFISALLLEQTLKCQELVMNNNCTMQDAIKALFRVDRESLTLEQALGRDKPSGNGATGTPGAATTGAQPTLPKEPPRRISFADFLKVVNVANDNVLERSLAASKENSALFLQIMVHAKLVDPNLLQLAHGCNSLMESGRLTVEHAVTLFDYARRKNVDINQALKELNWYQGDVTKPSPPPVTNNFEAQWSQAWRDAELALQEGRMDLAEQLWTQVLKQAETFGRENPRFVGAMEKLADVYQRLSKFDLSESLYSDALIIKTKVLPPTSLHIATTVNCLAKVNYFQGKYDASEKFALRFLDIYKQNFSEDHPDVACALQNIATLYHMQERYKKAEPYYIEALRICKAALGEHHPTTVRMNQNYSRLLQSLRKHAETDVLATGTVTGSWKAISIPSDNSLYEKLDD